MYPNPNGNQQQQGQGIGFIPGNPPYPQQSQGYPPYPQAPVQGYPPYPQQQQAPGYPPAYPQPGAQYPPPGAQYPQPGAQYPQPGGAQYPQYPVQGANTPYNAPQYPPLAQPIQGQFQATPYPQAGQNIYNPANAQASAYPVAPGLPYGQQQQPLTASHVTGSYAAPTQPGTMQQQQAVPTLVEGPCDPMVDAQVLRKAMKGIGTDEKAIINIVAKRTDRQRQQITQAFKASFGKDLIKDLKSELGGALEKVVLALMTPRFDYLAEKVHKAISGLGTKERVLVDVLCTSTNSELHMINASYKRLFNRSLESDLKGDTSGHFLRLLVSINTAGRNEDPIANASMATDDAQKLLSAGEKKWGTDESVFNMILATRSYAQLRLMFHEYERLTGHSFEKAIEKEFSGDVEKGMLAVVKCAKNRAMYFAERLHESIAGFGTKDDDLVFLLVTRAEIDLETIKNEYQKLYGSSLANAVSGDVSGDYKKILLTLLGM